MKITIDERIIVSIIFKVRISVFKTVQITKDAFNHHLLRLM